MGLKFNCQDLCCQDDGVAQKREDRDISRRDMLKLTLVGAGVAVAGSLLPWTEVQAGGQAEALLLSCMDYRLVDDIVRWTDGKKLTNEYDHVVLAGASLGAITDKFPSWGQTFWEHLDVAIKLHHIKKVIVLDHRDCGAYKVVLGKDLKGDEEKALHAEQMNKLRAAVNAKYPELGVELYLMALDGSVESIATS